MARLFHSDRTVEMILLTWLLALPLWFVVYKEMVRASLHRALIGLGFLGTFHFVVALASGHPEIERALLLVEVLVAGAGAAWLVRFLRRLDVPKRVREGLWFSVTSVWAWFALLTTVIGAGAAVLGYIFLGTEAAVFVVLGTIGATAYMALERIVEALVLTGVHTGRFDIVSHGPGQSDRHCEDLEPHHTSYHGCSLYLVAGGHDLGLATAGARPWALAFVGFGDGPHGRRGDLW